jgi:molybdate transport system substrate-binding protein
MSTLLWLARTYLSFTLLLACYIPVSHSTAQYSTVQYASSIEESQKTPLRIAVSSNFSPALKALSKTFTLQNNIKIDIITSATGVLFQQIKHGAPFDIFLAADDIRPQQLVTEQYAFVDSLHTYAYGQLALYSTSFNIKSLNYLQHYYLPSNTLSNNISLKNKMNNNKKQRFAIANSDIAPYGKAAKEALINLALWPTFKKNLVTGININQTFQQVRSGAVPAGIVANSQLVINNLNGLLIPQHLYSPIKQQLVILKRTKQKKVAEHFIRYLLSVESQQKIANLGYLASNNNMSQ